MAGKPTKMAIKVDLQCHRCFKKIKKILCGIPQVQDQNYEVAKNTVTITVVDGSPENVRQKILCKGRCFVQGVDILPEQKPKDDTKKKGGKKNGKEDKKEKEKTPPTKPPNPAPPVPTYPPVYVMAGANVCIPCHNRGCDGFCPCNCHYGRPPMCHDGCGRLAHECGCRRPSYLGCSNRCNEGNACSSRTPYGCGHGWPPVCSDAGYPQCQKSCLQM
ncbi:protein PYRICULARIA ORYZAE RESISTANCE 21-like [Syzygium oleosum]|uniref:protein PYRICULARIA ORYZAE RESISTANCE 21-like n=1 Tax=Syzygium oleosum TaxID=219896 RepID=UPI0024B8D755|nr:protein PYRICULARIA ORYZAE RESISTANCE 21-like [Syzygium oleosum]